MTSQHWAIEAFGREKAAKALEIASARGLSHRPTNSFGEELEENELLQRASLAYESVAIEALPSHIRLGRVGDDYYRSFSTQLSPAALYTYLLKRTLPLPGEIKEQIHFMLNLGSLSSIGGMGRDFRNWLKDHGEEILPFEEGGDTETRVLWYLCQCWISLWRGNPTLDLLETTHYLLDRELVGSYPALYDLTKATQILIEYLITDCLCGEAQAEELRIYYHFNQAFCMGGVQLGPEINWLEASARVLIKEKKYD